MLDGPLSVILHLLLFPCAVYFFLFPPPFMTSLWKGLVGLLHTPIDVDRFQHAVRKRTLRPDPFGDEGCEEWAPTPLEQLRTRTLLLRYLPPELVLEIMHEARYHSVMVASSNARSRIANGSLRYLVSAPISQTGRLEEVRLALRGRDQGWSDQRNLHGTYEGSTSYYELYLLRRVAISPTGQGDSSSTRSNPFTFAPSTSMNVTDEDAQAPEMEVSGSRWTVQYNVHASQFIKTHNLVLDPSTDPTLSLAQPGDRIAIDAVARYPGWLNQISGARIWSSYSFYHGPREDEAAEL